MTDIFKNHKLISDSTGYLHDTPGEVYNDLRKWLGEGFPKNYKEFIGGIAGQFANKYEHEFEGHELIGGIGGRSGNSFFVHDLAIVDLILAPVLLEFGKTRKGWEWIKKNILDKEVSAEAPTFAKRATVPLLLERLADKKTANEAKKYLSELIQLSKGIPSSSEVIFDKLRGKVDGLSHNVLLELVQQDLELTDGKIPTNVFVVILLFELIKQGNNEAEKILLGFLGNEEYLKYDGWHYHTLDHFHIIANRPDVQRRMFDRLLKQRQWAKKMEEDAFARGGVQQAFTSWATIEAKARIVREGNLDFLEKFREKGLRGNLVIKALPEVAKEYPEEVLQLLEGGILTKDVQSEIIDPYVREQIVRVAFVLAEKQREYHDQEDRRKRFAEGTLWILDHFMEDLDPKPFKGEPYDGDPEFDYDKKIRNGEDINVITSVRGNIPWVLQQLANYKEVLPEVYDKTKMLLVDENHYVVQQALVSLSIIAANSNLLPGQEKTNLRQLVFDLLEEHSACLPLASCLLRVFGHYRELNEREAMAVLEKLGHIDECAGLFIYFAVYRKDQYNKKFNTSDFEVLLKEKITKGDKNLRRKIAWHFWRILDDDISQVEKLEEFVTTLSESDYDRQVFGNLDYLIEVVIKNKKCAELVTGWFENSLKSRLEYTKKKVAEDKNFSDWMHYDIIFEGIAKWRPDDFILLLGKAVEIAETGQVYFYDVKKCFEASRKNPKLQTAEVEKKLDALWKKVRKIYPRADDSWMR